MDAVRLARLTTAVVVVGGGMLAGHVLMPYGAKSSVARRVVFWAIVAGLGALRGWRERVVAEAPGARGWAASYAVVAVLLAYVANWVVHGGPRVP